MSKYHRRHVTVAPGQRRTVYGKTKRELERKVRELLAKVDAGEVVAKSGLTVKEVAERWLPWHVARTEIAESTQLSYRQILDAHVLPLFGPLQLQHLTEFTIMEQLSRRQEYSSSMRRKILLTLRMVIKYGMRAGVIPSDPSADIPLPRQRNETDKDMHCLSLESVRDFLAACDDSRLGNLFTILVMTGMRSGELLALSVGDVLNDGQQIRIRRTLSDDKEGNPYIRNQPKTAAGNRTIPVPEIARVAIIDQLAERLRSGRKTDLLFATSSGTPHKRQNVIRRYFRPILKAAGLSTAITIHDLRHTYATLSLNAGVGVHLVSKMLGHASVKVTIDLYSHALPEATVEAAQALNDAVSRADIAESGVNVGYS